MRALPVLLLLSFAVGAFAQEPAERYPGAAANFLASELPAMERAVAERNRSYFPSALVRMQTFFQAWTIPSRAPGAMEKYPVCTLAVSDFLIAGLCRISEPGTLCEPATFLPKVEANIAACRQLAQQG